jgi:hypothetical protein
MKAEHRRINNALRRATGRTVAADDPADEAATKKKHDEINRAIRRAAGRRETSE